MFIFHEFVPLRGLSAFLSEGVELERVVIAAGRRQRREKDKLGLTGRPAAVGLLLRGTSGR